MRIARPTTLATLFVLAACQASEAPGTDSPPPPGSDYEGLAFEFEEVVPGIYHARGTGSLSVGSHGAVIVNDEDVLLVESHISPAAAYAVVDEIETLTDKPVRYVVNTHHHFDHAHGNQIYPPDVHVIGHEVTREMLISGGSMGRSYQNYLGGLPAQIAALEERIEGIEDEEERTGAEGMLAYMKNFKAGLDATVPTGPNTTLSERMTLFRGDREIPDLRRRYETPLEQTALRELRDPLAVADIRLAPGLMVSWRGRALFECDFSVRDHGPLASVSQRRGRMVTTTEPCPATRKGRTNAMDHNDYGGLHEDLKLTGAAMKRRDMLRLATSGVGMGALYLFGRADGLHGNEGSASTCDKIPEETAGPFPGDGSNGPNVLDKVGVVRSDIRPSFAGLSGVAAGVPLTVTVQLVDLQNGCKPAPGLAVYVWHCDRAGRYSLYNRGATEQNYLRGVQGSDSNGELSFTTIFPGCYRGRWPHIHFEVFPSLAAATDERKRIATSQLAFPEAACDEAYAVEGYEPSARTKRRVSLTRDSVFRDGVARQMATMSGDAASGFAARLTVAV